MPTHSYLNTHVLTHTHILTNAHTFTTHTLTHTLTVTHTQSHTHTHSHTHTYIHTHSQSYTYILTIAHPHTHTHTHPPWPPLEDITYLTLQCPFIPLLPLPLVHIFLVHAHADSLLHETSGSLDGVLWTQHTGTSASEGIYLGFLSYLGFCYPIQKHVVENALL
jgi:hypothetical protein